MTGNPNTNAGAAPGGEPPALHFVARDPAHPDAAALLRALGAALAGITGCSGDASFDVSDVRAPGAAFVVGYAPDGAPVACGGYRPLEGGVAEVKRVYASRKGAGMPLLMALKARAAADGYRRLVCETRRVNTVAVAFYVRAGWRICENYGKYVGRPEAVCFETWLAAQDTPQAQA